MLRNARITAQCDDGAEKRLEAVRQVHLAMYRAGLCQITMEEREQILESFGRIARRSSSRARPGKTTFWGSAFLRGRFPTTVRRPDNGANRNDSRRPLHNLEYPGTHTQFCHAVRSESPLSCERRKSDLGDPLFLDCLALLCQFGPMSGGWLRFNSASMSRDIL